MQIVTPLTVLANLILCVIVVYGGYFRRYTWLTYFAAFVIFTDAFLYRVHTLQPAVYDQALTCVHFSYVFFNLMVIFWTDDRRIAFPVELQLLVEFVAFLTKRAEFLWATYYLRCGLAVSNLLMLTYFIFIIWRNHESPQRHEAH